MKVTEFFVGFGPRHLVGQARRDRVRHQGGPARRLLPDHRHDQPRRGRSRRRAARVPLEGLPRARSSSPRAGPAVHFVDRARVDVRRARSSRATSATQRALTDARRGDGRRRDARAAAPATRSSRSTARAINDWESGRRALIAAPQAPATSVRIVVDRGGGDRSPRTSSCTQQRRPTGTKRVDRRHRADDRRPAARCSSRSLRWRRGGVVDVGARVDRARSARSSRRRACRSTSTCSPAPTRTRADQNSASCRRSGSRSVAAHAVDAGWVAVVGLLIVDQRVRRALQPRAAAAVRRRAHRDRDLREDLVDHQAPQGAGRRGQAACRSRSRCWWSCCSSSCRGCSSTSPARSPTRSDERPERERGDVVTIRLTVPGGGGNDLA